MSESQKLARHGARMARQYNRMALKLERKAIRRGDQGYLSTADDLRQRALELRVLASTYAEAVFLFERAEFNAEVAR